MLSKVKKILNSSNKIAVFTHVNPDGDALGSSIAFKLGLEQLDKTVDLYCDDKIHENYHFLNTQKFYIEHSYKNYDLAVILDCPELSRIGRFDALVKKVPKVLVIDHHLHNNINADVTFVDEHAGSVGVIIYRLFKELSIKFDKDIATAVYTAVTSDTGSFMHSNTTKEAHLIAANLFDWEIDIQNINFYLFKRKTKKQLATFARALNNLEYHEDNTVAISLLTKEDFDSLGATYIDSISISTYLNGIDGIKIAALLTEYKENCYLVSLRSMTVDTSLIAKIFNGGGHKQASGCMICGKRENVINKLLEACKKELK